MARNHGGPVEVAGRAYTQGRAEASDQSLLRVRWRYRKLQRQRDRLDDLGLVRLRSVAHELADRGRETPV